MSSTALFDPKKFKQGLQSRAGFSTTTTAFNPATKTGLLPDMKRKITMTAEGVATYVSAGTGGSMRSRNGRVQVLAPNALRAAAIQSGNGGGGYIRGVREGPTVEAVQRDRVRKQEEERRRKREVKELMRSDGGKSVGGEYVALAAQRRKEEKEKEKEKEKRSKERDDGQKEARVREKREGKGEKRQRKRKSKAESSSSSSEEGEEGQDGDDDDGDDDGSAHRSKKKKMKIKKAFSHAAVRLIGYDPTNYKDQEDEETKRSRVSVFFTPSPSLVFAIR